ncbi:MAG: GNAT family N-acetyltransferase [Chitinophagaceae bacterium]|nr:MAG: GNAT family N-acetyltransferase [Chitinophagaceae bacterium]
MMTFKKTNSGDTDFQSLVVLLDADLAIRDGDDHAFYDQFNKIANINHVLVCYEHDKAIACGAFKPYDEQTVEIKRMFVLPEQRNKSVGHKVLQQLENWARELSYNSCILETGVNQPEAIRLYQKAGYEIIKNYGQYENVENSVCMKKMLG